MSYSDSFPAQRPSFMFDAANSGRIPPNMTFSRASTGTFFSGTDKVLGSENLLLQSENFTTTWTIQDASGAAGATAPDGGTDGYTVTAHSGSSKGPRASQSLSGKLSTSTQYTLVGHLKAGTATHGYISFRGTNSNNYAYAQIQFSSPGSVSTGGAGFTSISGTVTALGSSWYKLTLTATTGSDVSGAFAFVGVNDGTAFGISGYPAWTSAGETLEVWGAQLSTTQAKVYDSPTTTQIARNYQTKLQTAASGAARFEHSATDGQSVAKGILLEGQSTNLVTRSEEFNSWTTGNASIQSNAAVAPDGTLSADTLTEAAETSPTTNSHYVYSANITPAASTSYTFSVYLKSAGRANALLYTNIGGVSVNSIFNLSNGTVTYTGGSVTNAISPAGNGYYRCSITWTTTSTAAGNVRVYTADGDTTYDYTGNGYGSVICWGAQVEASSFASSYLKTEAATVTRAADSLSVVDSSLFDNGSGALFVEASSSDKSAAYSGIASINDGSSNNRVEVYNYYTYVRADVGADGATQSSQYGGSFSSDVAYKACLTYDTNNVSLYANGFEIGATDAGATMPSVDRITLGNTNSGGNHLNGHLKRVAVYSEPISETAAAALTS